MSKSRRSSIRSAPFRIEWRPSRWVSAMLWVLALCAPFSLWMSDMPLAFAWPLALVVAAFGAVDASRYRRASSIALVIPVGRGYPSCDGKPMRELVVEWRGPLAFLRWRGPDGHMQGVVFWPDTLPSGSRRELRLAMLRLESARSGASMAR
jgi:toxin CptA